MATRDSVVRHILFEVEHPAGVRNVPIHGTHAPAFPMSVASRSVKWLRMGGLHGARMASARSTPSAQGGIHESPELSWAFNESPSALAQSSTHGSSQTASPCMYAGARRCRATYWTSSMGGCRVSGTVAHQMTPHRVLEEDAGTDGRLVGIDPPDQA